MSLVIGTIYPAAYQQFRVGPNEFQTEAPYIDRNIRATRDAFGLDEVNTDKFDFKTFDDSSTAEEADAVVDSNRGTIDNARLWDPSVIQETYQTRSRTCRPTTRSVTSTSTATSSTARRGRC